MNSQQYEFKGTPAPWSIYHVFNTPLKSHDNLLGEWEHLSPYLIGGGDKIIGDIRYQSIGAGWGSVDNIPEFEATSDNPPVNW